MTVEIPLSRGLIALVDDEDAASVGKYRWAATKGRRTWYARRAIKRPDGRWSTELMHTLLSGWRYVDHRNGNGLDNRRANLRSATNQQNHRNRRKIISTSRFKGVSWHSQNGRWCAQLTVDRRRYWLGYHGEEGAAARAYDEAAREQFGEFAALNFPLPGERSALGSEPIRFRTRTTTDWKRAKPGQAAEEG